MYSPEEDLESAPLAGVATEARAAVAEAASEVFRKSRGLLVFMGIWENVRKKPYLSGKSFLSSASDAPETPRSVMRPVTSLAGVTSNAGFAAALPSGARKS